jgi:hypothetical protein
MEVGSGALRLVDKIPVGRQMGKKSGQMAMMRYEWSPRSRDRAEDFDTDERDQERPKEEMRAARLCRLKMKTTVLYDDGYKQEGVA